MMQAVSPLAQSMTFPTSVSAASSPSRADTPTSSADDAGDDHQALVMLLDKRATELERESAAVRAAREELSRQRAEWRQQVEEAAKEHEEAASVLAEANAQLQADRGAALKAQADAEAAREKLEQERLASRAEFAAQMRRLQTVKDELDEQEARIGDATDVAAAMNTAAVQELEAEERSLRATVQALQAKRGEEEARLGDLIEEITTAEETLHDTKHRLATLMQGEVSVGAVAQLMTKRQELEVEVEELSSMRVEELQRLGLQPSPSAAESGATADAATAKAQLEELQVELAVYAEERDELQRECEALAARAAQLRAEAASPRSARTGEDASAPPTQLATTAPSSNDHDGSPAYPSDGGSSDELTPPDKQRAPRVQYASSRGLVPPVVGAEARPRRRIGSAGNRKQSFVARLFSKFTGSNQWEPRQERWYAKWKASWEAASSWQVVSGNPPRGCLSPSDAVQFADGLPPPPGLPSELPPLARANRHHLSDPDAVRRQHLAPGGPAEYNESLIRQNRGDGDAARLGTSAGAGSGAGAGGVGLAAGGEALTGHGRDSLPFPGDAMSPDTIQDPSVGPLFHANAWDVFGHDTDPTLRYTDAARQPSSMRVTAVKRLLSKCSTAHLRAVNWDALPHPCRTVVRHGWVSLQSARPAYGILLLDSLLVGWAMNHGKDFYVDLTLALPLSSVERLTLQSPADGPPAVLLHVDQHSEPIDLSFIMVAMQSGWAADLKRCMSYAKASLLDGTSNMGAVFGASRPQSTAASVASDGSGLMSALPAVVEEGESDADDVNGGGDGGGGPGSQSSLPQPQQPPPAAAVDTPAPAAPPAAPRSDAADDNDDIERLWQQLASDTDSSPVVAAPPAPRVATPPTAPALAQSAQPASRSPPGTHEAAPTLEALAAGDDADDLERMWTAMGEEAVDDAPVAQSQPAPPAATPATPATPATASVAVDMSQPACPHCQRKFNIAVKRRACGICRNTFCVRCTAATRKDDDVTVRVCRACAQ